MLEYELVQSKIKNICLSQLLLGLSDCVNFSITIFDYIMFIIKLENNSINTVKSKFYWTFIDPLVASYITHPYTLVRDSLDVIFGIKMTYII